MIATARTYPSLVKLTSIVICFSIVSPLLFSGILNAADPGSLAAKLKKRQEKNRENTGNEAPQPTGNPVYEKMLRSVATIETGPDEDNLWTGTGWVVDVEQRLLVTNHHVIEGMLDCYVFFPEYEDGKLITDRDDAP